MTELIRTASCLNWILYRLAMAATSSAISSAFVWITARAHTPRRQHLDLVEQCECEHGTNVGSIAPVSTKVRSRQPFQYPTVSDSVKDPVGPEPSSDRSSPGGSTRLRGATDMCKRVDIKKVAIIIKDIPSRFAT